MGYKYGLNSQFALSRFFETVPFTDTVPCSIQSSPRLAPLERRQTIFGLFIIEPSVLAFCRPKRTEVKVARVYT